MALSQKHRDIIYLRLAPILGVEAAEAFMAEFPTTQTTNLVSKDFLRAELADLRTELLTKKAYR